MQFIDITEFSSIRDDGENDVYNRVVRREVRDGHYVITVSVPGDLVPPVVLATDNPDITMHALRQYVEVKNQEARLRSMPQAERRQFEREYRRRQAESPVLCPGCGGEGWIRDHDDTQFPCPTCRPKV